MLSAGRPAGASLGSRRQLHHAALPTLTVLALSLICGLGVAGVSRPGMESLAVVVLAGAALGVCFMLLFVDFPVQWILAWGVVSVCTYPFLRFPTDEALVTFDRLWIGGTLIATMLHRRNALTTKPTRFLLAALTWFVAAYLVRALTTEGAVLFASKLWLDAILLPALLFISAHRLIASTERCRQLGAALTLAGGALALFGIAQYFIGFDLSERSAGNTAIDKAISLVRVSGPYQGPETYALALVLCLAATLYWIQARRGPAYLLGGAVVALELSAISITFFRAAWMAAIIVVIASLGFRPKRHGRLLGVAGAVVVGLALASTQVADDRRIATRVQNSDNVYGRIATYKEALAIFPEKPLFGVGVSRYTDVARARSAPRVQGVAPLDYPHSSYLGTLAEQGVFGFLPFLCLSLAAWWVVRVYRRRARSRDDVLLGATVGGALVGYLVMSLTLTMLPYLPSNAFLMVLLGAAAARLDAVFHGDTDDGKSTITALDNQHVADH